MPTTTVDFVVIGAGIAGLSAAAELAAVGSVALCEAETQPAQHTTGRSAATIIDWYGGAAISPFTVASRAWLASDGSGRADSPLLAGRGLLAVAQGQGHHRPDRAAAVTAADVLTMVPVMRGELIADAWYDDEVSDIDVAEVLQVYRRLLVERNGRLHLGARVSAITRRGDGWVVSAGDESISTAMIVNAAGAWADEIATLAGVQPVGLQPLRRTMFTFRHPPAVDPKDWPMVLDLDDRYYFKADAGQMMASPVDETVDRPCDARPDEIDVARAIDELNAATTFSIRSVTSTWAGLRTFAPDRGLVIGRDPHASSFLWCAGQGGFGIQTAPAVAATITAIVAGTEPPVSAEALAAASPARLTGRAGAQA